MRYPTHYHNLYEQIVQKSKGLIMEPSLAWPDPIFAQGRYRFQYKRPVRKGSGLVHRHPLHIQYPGYILGGITLF